MKIIKLIVALGLILLMLSGCKHYNANENALTPNTVASNTAGTNTNETIIETAVETENTVVHETVIGVDINYIRKSYASFTQFVEDADSLKLVNKTIPVEESQMYALMKRVAEQQAMYVDISDVEDTVTCECAIAGTNMYIKFNVDGMQGGDVKTLEDASFNVLAEMTIMVKGNVLYFIDEDAKICYYTEASTEEIDSLGYSDAIQNMLDVSLLDKISEVSISIVDIDGKLYQLEVFDKAEISDKSNIDLSKCGYLFNESGELCYFKAHDYGVQFNTITAQIPEGKFDLPTDYSVVSMDEMYGRNRIYTE